MFMCVCMYVCGMCGYHIAFAIHSVVHSLSDERCASQVFSFLFMTYDVLITVNHVVCSLSVEYSDYVAFVTHSVHV